METVHSISVSDGENEHRISLIHGDITELNPTDMVDLLVTSAFPNNYVPTEASLIGALYRSGLPVAELAADKEIDLRNTNGFWLSREIDTRFGWHGAKRLAVFEPTELGSPPEAVGAMFRGLFPFLLDDRDQKVAMPVLAAGDQRFSPMIMLEALLEAAIQWMRRGLPISDLMIFERDANRVAALRSIMAERAVATTIDGRVHRSDAAQTPQFRAPAPTAPTHDVFLSFSSNNADAADSFRRELVSIRPQLTVFDFRISINKGLSYQNEIDRAIESCKKIVVILTPSYFDSPECQEELNMARLRNKRSGFTLLIPLYWKTVLPDLPLWIQTLNWYKCNDERHDLMPSAAKAVDEALE